MVTVLDATMGEHVWETKLGSWVNSAQYSPDGLRVVCGDQAKMVTVLDAATGEKVWATELLLLAGAEAATPVGAIGMLLLLFPMMQATRGSPRFSRLVRMLEMVVRDMRAFAALLAAAVGTVAFALRLLKNDTEEYGTAFDAAMTSYAMMTMGDFDLALYNTDFLVASLFFYTTAVVNVVFLKSALLHTK
jgi:hypothetical protein